MRSRHPSIRARGADVAAAAGVSQSAVSRTFRKGGSVAPDTRARVIAAAEALGYRPNAMARAVTTRRSGVIAIVMFADMAIYYPEALIELNRAAAAHEVRVMLFTLSSTAEIAAVVDQIIAYQVDGVVALNEVPDRAVAALARAGVPLVLYNRDHGDVPADAVGCAHEQAGEQIAALLVREGHRRIGLLLGPPGSPLARRRGDGVRTALAREGLAIDAAHQASGDFTYHGGIAAAQAVLAGGRERLTAIVAINDAMALGAIDHARKLGLDVPADLSVVWLAYELVTMAQPVDRMAAAAIELIQQRLRDPHLPIERRMFSCHLRDGRTVAPPR